MHIAMIITKIVLIEQQQGISVGEISYICTTVVLEIPHSAGIIAYAQ